MIKSTFYKFDKARNSTKRPTGGTNIQIELKAPTDLINPTIVLHYEGTPHGFNYLHIPDFAKYYFIKSWRWMNGLWECDCTEDVLATWKDEIGGSVQYVLRASNTYDTDVADSYYPSKGDVIKYTRYSTTQDHYPKVFEKGAYVVGIINDDTKGVGAVHYYVFDQKAFNKFLGVLMGNTDWLGTIDEISVALQKCLMNPFQYVVSCVWLPANLIPVSSVVTDLPYGWWNLPGQHAGVLATNSMLTYTFTFEIPKHPNAADRGRWLNNSPYSTYELYLQPFGTIPIDSTKVYNETTLTAKITADPSTGVAICNVSAGDTSIYECSGIVGVPIQLAQMAVDYVSAAMGAVNTVGSTVGAAMSGNVAGAITTAVSGIADSAIKATIPQMQTSGANGSRVFTWPLPRLTSAHVIPVPDNNEHWGRPLCRRVRISDIPGYVMCADPDIEFPGTSIEQDGVRSYLAEGIYYE